MNSFTLNNTAADIDSAISRVVSADNIPTASSDNMVTSQGVKTAIDGLASSNILTVNSFTPTTLETSSGQLTSTDSSIPTSGLVNKVFGFATNVDILSQTDDQQKSWVNTQAGESPEDVLMSNSSSNNITGSGASLTIAQGVYAINLSTDLSVGRYTNGRIQVSFGTTYTSAVVWNNNTLHSGVLRLEQDNSFSNIIGSSQDTSGLVYIPNSTNLYIRYWQNGAAGQARTVYISNTEVQIFKLL